MSDTGIGAQRVTIQDAAKLLGVSESAIRKRINRGTLRYEKDELNGRMYVFVDGVSDTSDSGYKDTSDTVSDTVRPEITGELLAAKDETIEEMRDRISSLERQLDARTEELRRRDIIISQLTSRIPELETSSKAAQAETPYVPSEAQQERRDSPESPEEGTGEVYGAEDAGLEDAAETATEPHGAAEEPTETKRSWWRKLFGG